MCLLIFALKAHPSYPLILAANRDEYYDRPTAPASFWEEAPHLLSGKDLRAGGTWLGITKDGRIGAVTNYRDPASVKRDAPSRGRLVTDFLLGEDSPIRYLKRLRQKANRYNGFNLIIGKKDKIYWYSNRDSDYRKLGNGIYGLSNHLLDTPWPKVTRAKAGLAHIISENKALFQDKLFDMLRDRTAPDDKSLPDTGVGLEWERILSPIYILSPTYGTRSSTVLLIDYRDQATFAEMTFNLNPDHASSVTHEFRIEPVVSG